MIRTLVVATALVFAAPVVAEEAKTPTTGASNAEQQSDLSFAAQEKQARDHLLGQGYTNISSLNKDESGKWVGTAQKDGKTNFVAIALPASDTAKATN